MAMKATKRHPAKYCRYCTRLGRTNSLPFTLNW